MSGSSSNDHNASATGATAEVEVASLLDLLHEQDEAMQLLFAKALNFYVRPDADASSDKEKEDSLKQAIEASLNQSGPPC